MEVNKANFNLKIFNMDQSYMLKIVRQDTRKLGDLILSLDNIIYLLHNYLENNLMVLSKHNKYFALINLEGWKKNKNQDYDKKSWQESDLW